MKCCIFVSKGSKIDTKHRKLPFADVFPFLKVKLFLLRIFVFLHIWLWRKHYGPVVSNCPSGHMLILFNHRIGQDQIQRGNSFRSGDPEFEPYPKNLLLSDHKYHWFCGFSAQESGCVLHLPVFCLLTALTMRFYGSSAKTHYEHQSPGVRLHLFAHVKMKKALWAGHARPSICSNACPLPHL